MKKTIRLNYSSAERFRRDYATLKKGKLFVPIKSPLPAGTMIALAFNFQGIPLTFAAEGIVPRIIDKTAAARLKIPPGVVVKFPDGARNLLQKLDPALSADTAYRNALDLPPLSKTTASSELSESPVIENSQARPPAPMKGSGDTDGAAAEDETGLSMEWIKTAMAQAYTAKEPESMPDAVVAPAVEKKTLSAAERDLLKPAGDFIMNLTKAMLRSGYYAADHPGAKNAKQGLYDALQCSLADFEELVISCQELDGKNDIYVMGILDEPISVRTLVGEGVSELFVPKLQEYLNRSGLISIAIKKNISAQKFETFVDLMSTSQSHGAQGANIGENLSKTLAQEGLSEISLVFRDELIAIEENLPWRVEMAIQRLAKDLKLLPMFQGASEEAISNLRLKNMQDIIRPLRHPEFLKDLVINCYVIAKHLDHMQAEDIEQAVVEAFPAHVLLPTSKYIFEELSQLKALQKKHPDSEVLQRRFTSVKRILQQISNRMVSNEAPGARDFLEKLYTNGILTFEELPADAKYAINTLKMAAELRRHPKRYADRLLQPASPEDADIILRLLGRVLPTLIEDKDWPSVLFMTKVVQKAAGLATLPASGKALPADPMGVVFEESTDQMVAAYSNADAAERSAIHAIFERLGPRGAEILGRVVVESGNAEVLKDATDHLVKNKKLARHWALQILEAPEQPWRVLEKALGVLAEAGDGDGDVPKIITLCGHSHPQVRDKALNAVACLNPGAAEEMIVAALDDVDEKVRWRATNALNGLAALSSASQTKLLEMLRTQFPQEREAALAHTAKLAQLVRTIGYRTDLTHPDQFETAILEMTPNLPTPEKGLLRRLKKSVDSEHSALLSAVIHTLGQVGGPNSEAFLSTLAKGRSPQADGAKEALDRIRARQA